MENDLISRAALLDDLQSHFGTDLAYLGEDLQYCQEAVQFAPTIDAVEVVRCKDCKYKAVPKCCPHQINGFSVPDDWYCPMGVKEGT